MKSKNCPVPEMLQHPQASQLGRAQFVEMWLLQIGQLVGRKQHLDAARLSGRSLYEPGRLKFEDHLVDGRRRDAKVTLDVNFCRRTLVDFGIVVDEREVLSLLGGIRRRYATPLLGCHSQRIRQLFGLFTRQGKSRFVCGQDAILLGAGLDEAEVNVFIAAPFTIGPIKIYLDRDILINLNGHRYRLNSLRNILYGSSQGQSN
jgi:hypothetical protein